MVCLADNAETRTLPLAFSSPPPKTHTRGKPIRVSGHRYYNAGLGRWLSKDPFEEDGGLNLYGFLNNSPISRLEILGLGWKVNKFDPPLGIPNQDIAVMLPGPGGQVMIVRNQLDVVVTPEILVHVKDPDNEKDTVCAIWTETKKEKWRKGKKGKVYDLTNLIPLGVFSRNRSTQYILLTRAETKPVDLGDKYYVKAFVRAELWARDDLAVGISIPTPIPVKGEKRGIGGINIFEAKGTHTFIYARERTYRTAVCNKVKHCNCQEETADNKEDKGDKK